MMLRTLATALVFALTLGVTGGRARAQINELPKELENIAIEEHPGGKLPGDVELTDQNGQKVRLADYSDGKIPTVVVMAYYSCPMLCTLVLNGVTKALRSVDYAIGVDYRVLVVSIDPRDTIDLAKQKRDNYIAALGKLVPPGKSWDFAIGDEKEVRRLADALGFHYRWDEATKQYAHAAGAFLVTPSGIISRTLYGVFFEPRDMRLALVEASQGKLGSSVDKLTLFCFHYDPQKRGYVLHAKRAMQLGGLLTMILLGAWLTRLWRKHPAQNDSELVASPTSSGHSEHSV